jgi:hypothetical protein
VLREGQILVVPKTVAKLLQFNKFSLLSPVVPLYKISRFVKLDGAIKWFLLPKEYKQQIQQLDIVPS